MLDVRRIRDTYNIMDMYKAFITNSEAEYEITIRRVNRYKSLLNKIKFAIESEREDIRNMFGIYLYNFWEWNTDEYDEEHKLEKHITKVYNMFSDNKKAKYSSLYANFLKFFVVIQKVEHHKRLLVRIKNRKSISCADYIKYCKRFFNKVSNEVLSGKIYKFNNRIGCLLIEKVKPFDNGNKNVVDGKLITIDYKTTSMAKKKLLAEGKIPYKLADHEKHIKLGISYNGVKYVEYKKLEFLTKIVMANSSFKNRPIMKFIAVNNKMKETYDDILKSCKTVKDILDRTDLDMACRLQLIKKIDESYTIKYVRNNEYRSVYYREFGCKIRQ